MSEVDKIRESAAPKTEYPYISPEVYFWLRRVIGEHTNFNPRADLQYYVGQNVRGQILNDITKAYNAPSD